MLLWGGTEPVQTKDLDQEADGQNHRQCQVSSTTPESFHQHQDKEFYLQDGSSSEPAADGAGSEAGGGTNLTHTVILSGSDSTTVVHQASTS